MPGGHSLMQDGEDVTANPRHPSISIRTGLCTVLKSGQVPSPTSRTKMSAVHNQIQFGVNKLPSRALSQIKSPATQLLFAGDNQNSEGFSPSR